MSDHDFWGDTPDWTLDDPDSSAVDDLDGRDPWASRPGVWSRWSNRIGALWGGDVDSTRTHRLSTDAADSRRRRGDDVAVRSAADVHAAPTSSDERRIGADEFVDLTDEFDERPRGPRRTGGVDPLLARFGAAAVVLTLMVPVAINVAGDDGVDEIVASQAVTTADSLAADPFSHGSSEVGTPTDSEPTTATFLDPADLPPAIPVNDGDPDQPSDATASANDVAARGADVATDGIDEGDAVADPTTGAAGAEDQADRLRLTCAIDYTVVIGDYWISLADRAGVELAELLEANAATVETPLFPGVDICLPAGSVTPAPPSTAPPASATTSTTTSTTITTTSPTATTAPTTTTAPVAPAGPEEIVQIIRNVWPDELEERALEIAYRESRYVPTAKNFCCYGLFQIYWSVHQGWLADLGVTSAEQLFDPETNARAAYALYQRAGGWGPWSL